MPASAQSTLRRLSRRLGVGLFLDTWPAWAVASLLAAGIIVLVCRLFFPQAAETLGWLWLAPVVTTVPVLLLCYRRRYTPTDVIALADSLGGGHGVLLSIYETSCSGWDESPLVERASTLALPRLRPWRTLAPLLPAIAFLAITQALPQRTPAPSNVALADEIAAELTTTLAELKEQELIAPDDEKRLEEEIERIRRSARERVDASSWEAADALREQLAAELSEKQDAMKWAEQSLARYRAAIASDGGTTPDPSARAAEATQASAELLKALEKLAQSGLLAGAPPEMQQLLQAGKLPADAGALRDLVQSLSAYLGKANERFGDLARLGKEFGRFDPADFPIQSDQGTDGTGDPGRGGVTRGRADAELTWGKETSPVDRFKAQALPPGAARSPDDWAPVAELPGAPQHAPRMSTASAARHYAASAGQAAWRRTLAPRHQSAVRKYFDK